MTKPLDVEPIEIAEVVEPETTDFPLEKKKAGRPKGAKTRSEEETRFDRAQRGRRESDIFAGQGSATKYNVFRLKPELHPTTGEPVSLGYLGSHNPPFTIEHLRSVYGGGTYEVQRFEGGMRTNLDTVAIAGAPRIVTPPAASSIATTGAPNAYAPPAGQAFTLRDVIEAAKAMAPPPAPPPPSVKDQLEMLVAMKDVAAGIFGEKETGSAKTGLAGVIAAIPEKAWENISEAALTFAKKLGSRPEMPPAPVAPQTQLGAPVNVSPYEMLAKELKSAVLQGVQTGTPTPEALAEKLLELPQAEMLLPLLHQYDSDKVLEWLKTKLVGRNQALVDHPDVRKYLIATIRALRQEGKSNHVQPTPARE